MVYGFRVLSSFPESISDLGCSAIIWSWGAKEWASEMKTVAQNSFSLSWEGDDMLWVGLECSSMTVVEPAWFALEPLSAGYPETSDTIVHTFLLRSQPRLPVMASWLELPNTLTDNSIREIQHLPTMPKYSKLENNSKDLQAGMEMREMEAEMTLEPSTAFGILLRWLGYGLPTFLFLLAQMLLCELYFVQR
eukprot:g66403.t1